MNIIADDSGITWQHLHLELGDQLSRMEYKC